jgi:hypothetical protein
VSIMSFHCFIWGIIARRSIHLASVFNIGVMVGRSIHLC